ncbi:MAG TPA: preprotein translocase subunit YajC [Sedimentisphaerales bacterium]|nr:preprotein translocase subunit YajC [Sedimentisphaerales bacterium]
MNNVWILAQGEGNQAPSRIESAPVSEEGESMTVAPDSNAPPATQPSSPFGSSQLLLLGLMFVVMYFLLFRGPRKKQQEHRQMVQSLEKNDRVRTIGGIIGTVVDIKGDEITLKVDESNNTKIKVVSSAIGKNLSKENK